MWEMIDRNIFDIKWHHNKKILETEAAQWILRVTSWIQQIKRNYYSPSPALSVTLPTFNLRRTKINGKTSCLPVKVFRCPRHCNVEPFDTGSNFGGSSVTQPVIHLQYYTVYLAVFSNTPPLWFVTRSTPASVLTQRHHQLFSSVDENMQVLCFCFRRFQRSYNVSTKLHTTLSNTNILGKEANEGGLEAALWCVCFLHFTVLMISKNKY